MLSQVGARAVSDIGSTTGVATVILAMLSAATVASITLVGVAQLAPDLSGRLATGDPSSVHAPTKVVVTPHAAAIAGSESLSPQQPATARSSSPSAVTAVPAVLRSPAARVATRSPRVTLPRVHVDRPAATTPAATTPAVTTPAATTPAATTPALAIAVVANQSVVAAPAPTLAPRAAVKATQSPGYPDRGSSRQYRSRAVVAKTPSRQVAVPSPQAVVPSLQATVAVLGENQSSSPADGGACAEHADGGRYADGGEHADGGEYADGDHAGGEHADGDHAGGEHADGDHAGGERHDGYGDRGHDSGDPRHDHDGH